VSLVSGCHRRYARGLGTSAIESVPWSPVNYSAVSLPPRRDPRSEPGEVPVQEVLGRNVVARVAKPRGVDSSSFDLSPFDPGSADHRPPSDARPVPPVLADAEEDLLADLAGQLLREERARRAAEARVKELEEELSRADALRDRSVRELQLHIDELRREVLAGERKHAEERNVWQLESERALLEAQAEIALLRARRSPSVRAMAALSERVRPPEQADTDPEGQMAQELAAVRRTADEALTALKDLLQRKESVLAEGRAILERLTPPPPAPLVPRPDAFARPSSIPTPQRGISVPSGAMASDWPELIVGQDPEPTDET
jgi:hypothetical protein